MQLCYVSARIDDLGDISLLEYSPMWGTLLGVCPTFSMRYGWYRRIFVSPQHSVELIWLRVLIR